MRNGQRFGNHPYIINKNKVIEMENGISYIYSTIVTYLQVIALRRKK